MKVNKGTVFAVIAVIGTGFTAGLTAKSVLKAEEVLTNQHGAMIICEGKRRVVKPVTGEEFTKKEIAKLTWKCYILPTVSFVITAALIIGSDISNRKKYAALASAFVALNEFHRDYEQQIASVNRTLEELGAVDKPTLMVFNKIDAYRYVEKEADDLTPMTKENWTLEMLEHSWLSKENGARTVFISAGERVNIDRLREMMYDEIKGIHAVRYPYNNFLY